MWRWALVAVPFATSAFASLAYRSAVRRRFPPVGRFVEAGGVRMHVEVTGSGPAVVLVHGAAGVLQDFPTALREELARTHTVIAVDRPGHGHSSHGPRRLDVAGNVRAMRDAVHALGHERVTVIGHSYGAVLALRWALDAPEEVAAVVAVAPATRPYAGHARWGAMPIVWPGIGHAIAWTLVLPLGLVLAHFTRHHAAHPQRAPGGPPGPSRAFPLVAPQFRAFAENVQRVAGDVAEQVARYGDARTPLVVLAGRDDRVTPAAYHAEPMPARWGGPCELRVLESAGHMLLRSHGNEVVAAIARAETLH
ncbi:MAG: alpha/beta hydrolase [Candidatus Eisenbacteria bacterium]|uniref:Alpha/beta hydrolase n=1 Tax=Eiseniibacteriota bacterium TaxID=2212470 RepID=A0A933SG84_UNCEI|nr:alpha/beta hydrolase [Candidatus Eisenbacteria bacterium]